jgi:chromosome segregation ATPase
VALKRTLSASTAEPIIITSKNIMDRDQKRGGLRDSISTNSTSTQHTNRPSLDEEYQILTEQIVQLKMELATWKGKQDEHNLDKQHLNAEKEELRNEIDVIEAECITYENYAQQAREETKIAMKRLEQLRLSVAIEEEEAIPLRIEHDSVMAELSEAKAELHRVKSEEETQEKEIDKLERDKTQVLSEKRQIASEATEIEADVANMKKEIDKVQLSIEEISPEIDKLQAELVRIRKENDNICKKNDLIEARIVAMSQRLSS